MVFSSPTFLFFFLPITLLIYFSISKLNKNSAYLKNVLLLIPSLVFYYFGSHKFILLLLLTTLSSYVFGILIEKNKSKPLFITSILIPILSLLIFKYSNFFTSELSNLLFPDNGSTFATNFILPVGISFYTFQNLSYLLDVGLKKEPAEKSFVNLLCYISMFPQLIAGPIVRFSDIRDSLYKRRSTIEDITVGTTRFVYGLAKKIIIADACGSIADACYSIQGVEINSGIALLGAFSYMIQIYFDFSAYSDMAIGLGRIFGFKFPENFNRPYSAISITDFWRRWHITLSTWFRDYLYIPLGGSRNGSFKTYLNLWIVFIVTGIWHGANWTFILWGIYNGIILSFEKFLNIRNPKKLLIIWRIYCVILIYIGWIIFRATDIDQAFNFIYQIFQPYNFTLPYKIYSLLTTEKLIYIIAGVTSIFFSSNFVIGKEIEKNNKKSTWIRIIVMLIIFPYTLLILSGNNYSPFIYFQF